MDKIKFKPAGIFLIALLVGAITLSGCSLFQKRYEKTEKKEYKVNTAGKKKVIIDNTNGDIKVTRNSQDSVLIIKADATYHLTKKELKEDIERVKINIDSTGDVIKISSDAIKENKFQIFNIKFGSDINYELIVPEGLEVNIDNTNGRAEVNAVDNNVNIDITNGSVYLDHATGKIYAEITNGRVKGTLDSTKGLDIKTTNGSVSLDLSNSFSGRFKMETVNGKISKKEFDFTNVDEEKRYFKGTLNNGETEVKIETTNGKITLTKKH